MQTQPVDADVRLGRDANGQLAFVLGRLNRQTGAIDPNLDRPDGKCAARGHFHRLASLSTGGKERLELDGLHGRRRDGHEQ